MSAFLSVQLAARRLGVSPVTIRRWTATGFLPCTRTAGGHRRIAVDDIEELARAIGGSSQLAARRARERELDTIVETSIAVASEVDLQPLLAEIARRVTHLLDCDFCAVSTYDRAAGLVRTLAEYDIGGARLPDTDTYDVRMYPLTRKVLEEHTPAVVNVDDPRADAGRGRHPARRRRPQPAHAAAGLPRRGDRPARGQRRPARPLLLPPGAAPLPGRGRAGGSGSCTTRRCAPSRAPVATSCRDCCGALRGIGAPLSAALAETDEGRAARAPRAGGLRRAGRRLVRRHDARGARAGATQARSGRSPAARDTSWWAAMRTQSLRSPRRCLRRRPTASVELLDLLATMIAARVRGPGAETLM